MQGLAVAWLASIGKIFLSIRKYDQGDDNFTIFPCSIKGGP